MSIRDILVAGIATARTITLPLHVTVQHSAWTGQDFNGKDTFATASSLKAIVNKEEKIFKKEGIEVAAKTYIAILQPIASNGAAGRSEPVDTRDKFVLPDGTTGPVVEVSGFMDGGTGAPYFYEIYLGE